MKESYERKPLEELGDIELSEDEVEEEKYHPAPSQAVLAATIAAASVTTAAEVHAAKNICSFMRKKYEIYSHNIKIVLNERNFKLSP